VLCTEVVTVPFRKEELKTLQKKMKSYEVNGGKTQHAHNESVAFAG
jgi:hypothetical protein